MRVTASQVDQLRERLAVRDWQVVESVERLGIVSAGQLRRLHWPERHEARTARRRLHQLSGLRVISRLSRRIGGIRAGSDGYVYRLDVAGRRLRDLDPGRRPHTPGRTFLVHAIDVSEIYVRAVERARTGGLEVIDYAAEPRCWRTWGAGVLKPDAYLVTATGEFEDHRFIELDRATESGTTIARKAQVYERYLATGIEQDRLGIFPSVLWIVPDERRRSQLVDVLGRRPAESWQLHHVAPMADIPQIFISSGKDDS